MIGNPKKLMDYLYYQDKDTLYELKEYKEKRNKDQNAKYWKLLNELALKIRISPEELHFNLLKQYSPRYEILVPSDYEIRGIQYYEKLAGKKQNEKKFIVYRVYTPSHDLNTSEFALLLQGLCDECKEQGIETLSPDELKELEVQINEGKSIQIN